MAVPTLHVAAAHIRMAARVVFALEFGRFKGGVMRTFTGWAIAPFALDTMIGLAIAGCGFHSPVANGDASIVDTSLLDINADVPIDTSANCFGTGLVQICLQTPPTTAVTLGNQTIDTGNSPMCVAYTSIPSDLQACVIAGTMISLPSGTFRAAGALPLVVIASGNIGISNNATIDVASHRGGTIGAAGNASQCAAGTPPTQIAGAGGGGYGGGFGGPGGNGNKGASDATGGTAAATSGVPTVLRGGCPGSPGADGNAVGGAGTAGDGGGAVLLIAGGMIRIDGEINASGSAGSGGGDSTQAGAGGGGSGGMITLDASMVTVSAGGHVWANGGGGGGGASSGAKGNPGKDSTGPATVGTGGTGGMTFGGDGGNGSVSGTISGSNGNPGTFNSLAPGGGGAGGGGAGVILIRAATMSGTGNTNNVAPPPSS